MTITKQLLSVGAFALLIGFTSCDNDDEKGASQLPKDEAKTKITQFNTEATSDLEDLADADGLEAVQNFFDLVSVDDPFGRVHTDKKKIKVFFQQKGREFKKAFVPAKSISGRTNDEFNFNENKGLYEWNTEIEQFEKTGNADVIKLRFPTEGSVTNDAELQLTAYSEMEFYDEELEEYIHQPEVLKASLFVDNVKQSEIDLNIDWDASGFPLTADISLFVLPYSAQLSFDVSNATTSTLNVSMKRAQETLLATSLTVEYKNSNKSEDDVKAVKGFVQFSNLKLQGDINVDAANETEVKWEDIVDLELLADNKKLGDIIFIETNDEVVAYLQYADGTKEKLETLLQPVVDELENISDDLETNG